MTAATVRAVSSGLVAVMTLAAMSAPATAQVAITPAGTSATWVDVGPALGTAGLGFQLEVSRYRQARLLRLRLGIHTPSFMATTYQAVSAISEVSLLAGRGAPCCGSNWGGWAAGGGLVSIDGDSGSTTTVGAAAEVFMISSRFPHLTASAFGNVNPKRPFAGIGLALAIGRMPFAGVPAPRGRF